DTQPSTEQQAPTSPAAHPSETPTSPTRLAEPIDSVPTHTDRAADTDELGRSRLAEVLADRIRRVTGEDLDREVRKGRTKELAGTFMVHVHAPWGSGKTSLLNFLRRELRKPREPHLRSWVVVDFSAWQHQRLSPPWWWLMAALRRDALAQLR